MKTKWWQRGWLDPYGDSATKREARQDASLAQPPWNSFDQPQFLRELFDVLKTTVESSVKRWHALDEKLLGNWQKTHIAFSRATQSLAEALEGEELAQQQYEKVHGRRLNIRTARLLGTFYWLFIAIASASEFPFNALSFQLYSESLLMAWIVTGIAALTIVACGHFLGEQLHHPAKGHPMRLAMRIFLIGLPLLVIAAVAVLRALYIEQEANALLMSPLMAVINAVLSLGIFFTVVFFSYRAHEPATVEVLKAISRRERRQKQLDQCSRDQILARTAREKAFRREQTEASGFLSEMRRRASLYRKEHIRSRSDCDQHQDETPTWFKGEPNYELPSVLAEPLEWPHELDGATLEPARSTAESGRQLSKKIIGFAPDLSKRLR